MFLIERQEEILAILRKEKSVSVAALARRMYTSDATIRRDLTELEKRGVIKRTYGGAVLIEGLNNEIPLFMRENEMREAKLYIAGRAADLIQENSCIILDSSSTTFHLTGFLSRFQNLTVITNGAKTALSLSELHTKVFCTGGMLRENSLSYIGQHARRFMEGIQADILFFSCRALSLDGVLYDSSPEEAELRQMMIRHAKQTVLLCDSSKIGKTSFYKICGASDISQIICETPLPGELQATLLVNK